MLTFTHSPNPNSGPPWVILREDTRELVRHEYTEDRAAYVAQAMTSLARVRNGTDYVLADVIHAAQLMVLDNLASEMLLDGERVFVCSPDGKSWVDLEERIAPKTSDGVSGVAYAE